MHPARFLSVAFALAVVAAMTGAGTTSAQQEPNYLCTDNAFRDEMLALHNTFRARHQAPGLDLDQTLNKVAEEWAQHLARTHSFEHRPNSEYGENLYMMTSGGSGHAGAAEAFRAWADEEAVYDYDNPGFASKTGHFTQVVWKGTERLGVARACAPDSSETYVVANYDPPGNYQGRFPDNVHPAR
ncbi:CAP family protein [Nocardia sp. NBC_01730]|uniref:CAP family protein n=1 Tax=Nocardia sp. NBC_01730 TaxID=2975998 RepID=UPI002E1336B4|nr:CAP family protein [Nocardia sp. NBC_01730]